MFRPTVEILEKREVFSAGLGGAHAPLLSFSFGSAQEGAQAMSLNFEEIRARVAGGDFNRDGQETLTSRSVDVTKAGSRLHGSGDGHATESMSFIFATPGVTVAAGDADGDAAVDGNDFLIWSRGAMGYSAFIRVDTTNLSGIGFGGLGFIEQDNLYKSQQSLIEDIDLPHDMDRTVDWGDGAAAGHDRVFSLLCGTEGGVWR
jgi:hypothetical protein